MSVSESLQSLVRTGLLSKSGAEGAEIVIQRDSRSVDKETVKILEAFLLYEKTEIKSKT